MTNIYTIVVPDYISSRVYFIGTVFSRAYITNELSHVDILLENETADLWNLIVQTQDYSQILAFSQKINMEDGLDDFLFELESIGLIQINSCQSIEVQEKNYINSEINIDESFKFETERKLWCKENNIFHQLFFELTNKCNLKCAHCYNDKTVYKNQILSFEYVKQVIDEAYQKGLYCVTLSGGECTLHNDFLKIVKYIRSKRLVLSVFTNGQIFYDNPQFLEEFLNCYPSRVCLSLYSMIPEVHDRITGVEGSFHKTISVIKKLREKNVFVQIKCFVMQMNFDSYKDVLKFAEEIGASSSIDIHFLNNKNNNNCHIQLSENQMESVQANNDREISPIKINKEFFELPICAAADNCLTIGYNLDVYSCPSLSSIKMGNLKEASLDEILNSEIYKKMNSLRKKDLLECYKQEYCKFCVYCPGMAMLENGYLKKSDICCKIAKSRYKVYKKRVENASF